MMAAAMANRGQLNGVRLFSEAAWTQLHSDPKEEIDSIFGTVTWYTKGGINKFQYLDGHRTKIDNPYLVETFSDRSDRMMYENRDGWYGWLGVGGSIMQWHPELKIGFGYVPSSLLYLDFANVKGAILQKLVVDIVRGQKSGE